MAERIVSGGSNYPNKDTLSAAGTGQIVTAGPETTTFAVPVHFITVTHVDKDCFIAKTKAKVEATSGGAADDRIFIRADTRGLVFPWSGTDVFFLNAVALETPTIYVVGHL